MLVSYKFFFPQIFTSHVFFNSNKLLIKTNYVEGPLKDLKTEWVFDQLDKNKTKVLFNIKFEFHKFLHQKLAEFFLF